MQKQPKKLTINQYIIGIVRNEHPETVEQLVELVQQKFSAPQREIMEHILYLKKQGKLTFKDHLAQPPTTIKDYLFSTQAVWFWVITALALASTAVAFTVNENALSIVYARYILGSLFVLYLPGYSLIKALFRQEELSNLERTVLSMVTSLIIVIITTFILNYTPWGITLISITFSLLAITITFAITAVIQEHQAQLKCGQKET